MKITHLKGLIAAPFTPMNKNGSLNLQLIPKYYELLKRNAVAGAFICGSTGEGVSLTMTEKKKIAQTWASCNRDDKDFKILQLVGGTCLDDCVELAQHAQDCGLYAFSLTSPFYFKPANVEVLANICKQVGERVPDFPFYYYHIPALTGVSFSMIGLLKQMDGQLPNFVGVKYTHEDFKDYLTCVNYSNGKFDILWGRDESFLPALMAGAKGAVGSTFNYAAPLYHDIMELFDKGDFESARQKQQLSIEMIDLLEKYGGIATGKTYMKLIGLDCGNFRLPVKNMDSKQFMLFKKEVEKLKFRSFCSQVLSSPNRL